MHHVVLCVESFQWQTARSMAVAGARATNHHVGDRVVIFLMNLRSVVQQIVTE